MPQFIRHHVDPDTHNTVTYSIWALPILAGILVGCLLAFLANVYLKETRWASSAAFEVSAAPESKLAPKKPVRYEAIISNWEKYRMDNPPKP